MQLVELVYEGGDVLDVCLQVQRDLLAGELRDRFRSIDMRRVPLKERTRVLQLLSRQTVPVANVLVRGLSGVREACGFLPRAAVFMDALGRSEWPEPSDFFMQSQRCKRAFVYGDEMSRAVRRAGIGAISIVRGPYLPAMSMPRPDPIPGVPFVVGVPSLGDGVLQVIAKLRAAQSNTPFNIVAQENVKGIEVVPSCFDVAEACDLLVVPDDQMDRGGPSEAGILALATRRALCTTGSNALECMAYASGKFLLAERRVPGTYAACALLYVQQRAALDAWPETVTTEWDVVPREILRRL